MVDVLSHLADIYGGVDTALKLYLEGIPGSPGAAADEAAARRAAEIIRSRGEKNKMGVS